MAVVTFETKNTDNGYVIGIATLNVEKALNALNLEMIELLYNQLLDWQSDEHVSRVLLQGAGDKAFAPAVMLLVCTMQCIPAGQAIISRRFSAKSIV